MRWMLIAMILSAGCSSGPATDAGPVPYVTRETLRGGKQEGVELIHVDNGVLRITLVPTRGMGVLSVTKGGLRLGWDSPVKEVVHPRHINLQSRGGLGWLEGFNEWMVRCGLESAGHPGQDKFVNNVGDEATMDLTLHGKIGNIPASEVRISVDAAPPHRIRVRGRVDERMFYGPKLELWTELSTEPGSSSFRISDVLTNRGADAQEFEMIYHCNYGAGLLEKGASFAGPAERVTPFNDHAAKSTSSYAEYDGPKLGFVEQVYCLRLNAGADGRTLVMLQNAAKDRAVSMSWPLAQLPVFTLWKNTNALEEGYVTGLEPGTNFAYNRRIERKAGRVQKLAAGATKEMSLDVEIHEGAANVQKVAGRIAAIQAGKSPRLDEKPDKPE